VACANTKEITSQSYLDVKLESNTHKSGAIEIIYPQVSNQKQSSKVLNLNDIIKLQSLNILNGIEGKDVTLELSYEINSFNNEYLSISFAGHSYFQEAAYPQNIFYTVNIDLNDNKVLRLSDVSNDYQRLAKYILNCDTNGESKEALEYIKQKYNFNEMVQLLETADNSNNYFEDSSCVYSYYKDDIIGISFSVPHAIGDYVIVETPK